MKPLIINGFTTEDEMYYSYVINDENRGDPWSKDFISIKQILINDKYKDWLLDSIVTSSKEEVEEFNNKWKV